jgi:hypothetical protein
MSTHTDADILANWYRFASGQLGFVDSYLQLLRERQGKSLTDQQREYGASDENFLRLRGMKLPRSNTFTKDAERIANACQLSDPFAFVRALMLARKLATLDSAAPANEGYQAAFDEMPDLDAPPETE